MTESQQEEVRGNGGARGRGWGFSLSRETESCSSFVIIAGFVKFMSVLEEGLRPKVLSINISKKF